MSEKTVTTYPYIMELEDDRRIVVDRLPPGADGIQRLVAYELGPVDWQSTILLNPIMVEKMGEVLERVLEKFKVKKP